MYDKPVAKCMYQYLGIGFAFPSKDSCPRDRE